MSGSLMALVAIASVKGAPGASTTALSLAATWPRRALLAELDPDGGDLRYRLRAETGEPLDADRGLVGYAAGVVDGADVLDHVQAVPGGLQVLLGVSSATETDSVHGRWASIGALLDTVPDADVLADCGRLHPYTPIEELLPYAAALLVVTRPTVDAVAHLRSRLQTLRVELPTFVAVVTGVADRRSPREVQAVLDEAGLDGAGAPVTVLGRIAYDPAGAGTLAGEWSGKLNSSALMRSARELGHQLVRELDGLQDQEVAG